MFKKKISFFLRITEITSVKMNKFLCSYKYKNLITLLIDVFDIFNYIKENTDEISDMKKY